MKRRTEGEKHMGETEERHERGERKNSREIDWRDTEERLKVGKIQEREGRKRNSWERE